MHLLIARNLPNTRPHIRETALVFISLIDEKSFFDHFMDIIIQNNRIPVFLFIICWSCFFKSYNIISCFIGKRILPSNTIAYSLSNNACPGWLIFIIKDPAMFLVIFPVALNTPLSSTT